MPLLGNPHCFRSFWARFSIISTVYVGMIVFALSFFSTVVFADQVKLGEAFVTRFSGVETVLDEKGKSSTVLKLNGVVGSLLDIGKPLALPMGQHWKNEPQHLEILASETGQVFGIAFDDATPPNIYVSATSAFGLHRTKDNRDWAQGMWGKGGGLGTIYKLNSQNNYAPEVFAQVRLQGRENTGPALGNLAYDTVSKQLFVSDLETGMIHRFDIATGQDLGHYDHGVTGRSRFFDAQTGTISHLKTEAFKPECTAQVKLCKGGFSSTPSCWNYASGDRRVWGLDIRTMPDGSRRLFYATWGSVDGSDGANAIWSVGIDKTGGFAIDKIAREFVIPALLVDGKIAFSAPTDLAFSSKGDLLIGERGAPRNYLGKYQSPFARPTISRSFEYRLGLDGRWIGVGQYDVGNRPAGNAAQPRFDNSAGGVAWGFGYDKFGRLDPKARDRFVWTSGDSLCSKAGKCFDLSAQNYSDSSHIVGIEGRERGFWRGNIDKSFKIDSDVNVGQNGVVDEASLIRNDDSQGAGDVEVYQGPSVVEKAYKKAVKHPAEIVIKKPIMPVLPNNSPSKGWADKIAPPKATALPVPKFAKPVSKALPNPIISAPNPTVLPTPAIAAPKQAILPIPNLTTPKQVPLPKPVISAPKRQALPVPKLVPLEVRKVPTRPVEKMAPAKAKVLPRQKPVHKRVKPKRKKIKPVVKAQKILRKKLKPRRTIKRKTVHRKIVRRKIKLRKVKKRLRLKRKVKKRLRRKTIHKKRRHKKRLKPKARCSCKCKCAPIKPKLKRPKRVLHPNGKVDYTGARKVKVFVPSKP